MSKKLARNEQSGIDNNFRRKSDAQIEGRNERNSKYIIGKQTENRPWQSSGGEMRIIRDKGKR